MGEWKVGNAVMMEERDEQARQRDRRESRRVPLAVNASVAEIYSYLIGQDKTDQISTSK